MRFFFKSALIVGSAARYDEPVYPVFFVAGSEEYAFYGDAVFYLSQSEVSVLTPRTPEITAGQKQNAGYFALPV